MLQPPSIKARWRKGVTVTDYAGSEDGRRGAGRARGSLRAAVAALPGRHLAAPRGVNQGAVPTATMTARSEELHANGFEVTADEQEREVMPRAGRPRSRIGGIFGGPRDRRLGWWAR